MMHAILIMKCHFSCFVRHLLIIIDLVLYLKTKIPRNKIKPQQRRDKLQNLTCDQCNKEFSSRGSLNQHLQLHTGQFRHHCLICRKGFNSTSHYKLHVRSHEGVKYHCDYCVSHLSASRVISTTYPTTRVSTGSSASSMIKDLMKDEILTNM